MSISLLKKVTKLATLALDSLHCNISIVALQNVTSCTFYKVWKSIAFSQFEKKDAYLFLLLLLSIISSKWRGIMGFSICRSLRRSFSYLRNSILLEFCTQNQTKTQKWILDFYRTLGNGYIFTTKQSILPKKNFKNPTFF